MSRNALKIDAMILISTEELCVVLVEIEWGDAKNILLSVAR
jgi:hypothetical protein